ncbi:hypothetical protein SAMN05421806_116150 [Streptomyces indicus]|uniref:PH domain-containing protein n=1 Tax=Streptomyces indicus TaxID=417292 RepID=A0A1G9GQP2_9ACTN|nr:hypothetical protein SAMN05421806_116150 [Streptomyces indicus]
MMALLAMPLVGLAVTAAGDVPPGIPLGLGLIAALAGFILLGAVHTAGARGSVTGSRLTARTWTGERTLDLSVIEQVQLWTGFSYGGVSDRVILVRDRHGVCLGLADAADHRRLRRALEQQSAGEVHPKVSRAAKTQLGLVSGGLAVHTVLSWLATILGLSGYAWIVMVLAARLSS